MAKTPVSSSLDSSNQSGRDPEYRDFVDKKLAAGICGILLGGFGVHKFLLGLNNAGLIMLAVSLSGLVVGPCLILPLFGPAIMGLIGLVEGVLYLTKSQDDFYQTYAVEKKEWF
jgi:TM2 domain-containing membrane protein YozV